MKPVRAADLFCGAGGTSQGLAQACDRLGRRLQLVAVNHDATAIATHAANHPRAKHLCTGLEAVDPRQAVPGGKLDLLVASPECTHHSQARGGRPVNDQRRASAWLVLRWLELLQVQTLLVENVPEFEGWGPIGSNGRPLRKRRGETFLAWTRAIESLGYRISWRVLNAADYGDATTRQRLFVIARRGRAPLRWPEPTHAPQGRSDLFGQLPAWRPAREVIDWTHKGTSIWGRKRPLAENTMKRILAGLRKFGGEAFTALISHQGYDNCRLRSLDEPLHTITAGGQGLSLCEPFLVPTNYGERPGQSPRTHSIDEPVPTVVGTPSHALVEPWIMSLSQSGSNGDRLRPAGSPLPTVTTADDLSLVAPFILQYNRASPPQPVGEPLHTITTVDRFGLVEPLRLDILFRMLTPGELASAMSFPDTYQFRGNREQIVKQIGNAVACRTAQALCEALLAG